MKSKLKYIMIYLLGIITCSSIVYAYNNFANNIGYDNSTSGLKDATNNDIDNVQDAIDALYTKTNKYNSITVAHCNSGHLCFNELRTKYNKFKITRYDGTSTNYILNLLNDDNIKVYDSVVINQEYPTSTVTKTELTNNQSSSLVCAYIMFYN